jgi:iron complex outermembrane receptor protein
MRRFGLAGSAAFLLLVSAAEAQTATVTGTITASGSGRPLSGATIAVVETGYSARSRGDGTYALRVPPGSYTLRATSIGFAPATRIVEAGSGGTVREDIALERSAVPIDPLVSIGARGHERTATKSAVPVDVISTHAIESTGLPETWEIIQRLVPSANVTRVPLQDDHVRALSLRGLSPEHVLVLVNGKRRHNVAIVQIGPVMAGTSPVDLSGIPPSAIERIEVLRDGAAAQYGSDAIAGVVNVILKRIDRPEAALSLGSTYTSEGGREFRDGRNAAVSLGHGKVFQDGASFSISAQLRDRDPTNRAYPDPRRQYFPGDPRNDDPPKVRVQLGDVEATDAAVQLAGSFPLAGHAELYAMSGTFHRAGLATTTDYRTAMSDNTVRALHPEGFLPGIGSRMLDFSSTVGGRGTARGWRWDLSSTAGSNSFRFDVGNTNNVSLGSASPTSFYVGSVRFAQWTSNFDISRSGTIGALPVVAAAGAEVRRDSYRIRSGEPDSWRDGGVPILDGPAAGRPAPVGSQGLVGYRPSDETNARRTSVAAYADFDGSMSRSIRIALAGRSEHYSDFGSTHNARASVRAEPAGGIALRAAFGTGFRAPSLIHSFYSTTRAARIIGAADIGQVTIRTLPVGSPEAKLLGAQPLMPERSINLSAGLVLTFRKLPTLTADYYAIDVDDRIIQTGNFFDSTIARMFAERGFRGVGGGNYFANAIDTKTRGLDVVAAHGFSAGNSETIRLTATYNRSETSITRVSAMPAELSAYQTDFFGRDDSARVEVAQPRSGGSIGLGWSGSRATLDLNNRRFGRTVFLSTNRSLDQVFGAKWITDISGSYRFTRRLRVTATAVNLFDAYPDEWRDFSNGVAGVISFGGTIRYPAGHAPFGINGRRLQLRLTYREP